MWKMYRPGNNSYRLMRQFFFFNMGANLTFAAASFGSFFPLFRAWVRVGVGGVV